MQAAEDEELNRLLSSFECELDPDIESFLVKRAVPFEQLSKSRTYLVIDEDELKAKTIGEITVLGYISLAPRVLSVPDEVSNRVRKELDGLSAKIHGAQITSFPVYLIGQLGRNSKVTRSVLPGGDLLALAFDVIQSAVDAVGGRYILIECHEDERLVKFYRNHAFDEFAKIPDLGKPMVQMIRRI